MPHYDDIAKPVQQEEGSSKSHENEVLTRQLRQVVPNVCIAIREYPSTTSTRCGDINTGDVITVSGAEFDAHDIKWFKVVAPVEGYCISRHHMAKPFRDDESLFITVNASFPPPSSSSISSDTTSAPPSNLKSKIGNDFDNCDTSASCKKAKGSGSGDVRSTTAKKTKLRHVLPNVSIALRAETSVKSKKLGAINTGDIITIVGDEITVNSSTTGELNSTWYRVVRPLKGFCISSHPLANALRSDGKIFISIDDDEEHMDDSSPTTNFGGDAIDSVMRLIVPNAVVNIRHQPSISSKVVGAIKSGEIIKADRFIRGFNNMDWYRLVTPVKGGYCTANHPFTGAGMFLPCAMGESNANGGSVTTSHTSSSNPSDYGFPPFPTGDSSGVRKVLFIEGVEIRIRASPSFSAEIISGVAYNDEVVVTAERVVSVGGTDTEWYQITHPARGYVMSRHRCAYQKGYDTDNLFNDVNLPRPCPGSPTVQGIAITQDQPFVVGDVLNEPILPPFAQRSAEYQ